MKGFFGRDRRSGRGGRRFKSCHSDHKINNLAKSLSISALEPALKSRFGALHMFPINRKVEL